MSLMLHDLAWSIAFAAVWTVTALVIAYAPSLSDRRQHARSGCRPTPDRATTHTSKGNRHD